MKKNIDVISGILNELIKGLESGEIREKREENQREGYSSTLVGLDCCDVEFDFNVTEGICALTFQIVSAAELDHPSDETWWDCIIGAFFASQDRDPTYPVGGENEFQSNEVLWWDDEATNSKPMWRERIALLKDFIKYLGEQ